jgi:predicted transcriptional regulator
MTIHPFSETELVMPETQNTPLNDTKPENAETKVRRALSANPGTTAAALALAAGVGRSTATKILSRLASDGIVTRTAGKDQSVPPTWTLEDSALDGTAEVAATGEDAPATADQENLAPTGDAAEREADPSPVTALDASTASDPAIPGDPTTGTSTTERLPKGALYAMVRELLQAHPGEQFGPAKIGTALVRSSGAVNNALEKLVTNGLATKTCEAPKRFTAN